MIFTRNQITSLAAHVRAGKSLATHDIGHKLADVLDEYVEVLEQEHELAKPLASDDSFIRQMNEMLES